MDAKMNVLFFLRKAKMNKEKLSPIYLRVTICGKRFEVSTDKFIDLGKWSKTIRRKVAEFIMFKFKKQDIYLESIEYSFITKFEHYLKVHDDMNAISSLDTRTSIWGDHRDPEKVEMLFNYAKKMRSHITIRRQKGKGSSICKAGSVALK